MDVARVDYFLSRYRTMSDEELANLLIDRHARLSEEANAALTQVLNEKPDKAAFDREIQAKVDDLNGQVVAARLEGERLAEHRRQSRRALRVFFIAAVVILTGTVLLRRLLD